jgi:DNA-binding NtrC family response regulator
MDKENLILIIDDDIDIHYFLKRFFRKAGVNTLHAETLNDAKSKLLAQPSYIFLDNQLPDGLGLDFIPQIQALSPGAVIIVMTAYMPTKIKNEASKRGVEFFIEKPFSLDQIHQLIAPVLQS